MALSSLSHARRQDQKSGSDLDYVRCEPRQLLATLAEAGISQRAIDLINNEGEFANQFVGDIGDNNNSAPDVVYTDFVLNDVGFQNTIDAIASSEVAPAGAELITTKTELLNDIVSGTVANPNVYLVQGDFTLANNETINVPSNVDIYIDGSIFKQGTYTAISQFNDGDGEAENTESFIFLLEGSDNVKLVGVDNAKIHSNPTLATTSPHATGFRLEGSATNVVIDGFEMEYLWQGVDAMFNTREVVVKNNFIHNSVKRAIWFLGTSNSVAVHNFTFNNMVDGIDFDAFTADSLAYENVLIASGRFSFFVEEGANNNVAARNLAVVFRVDSTFFNLGITSNGTGNSFANNNFYDGSFAEYTRDNFFVDNVTFHPSTSQSNSGGDYFAQGDNGVAGNHYFFANRRFGVDYGSEAPTQFGGRNLSFKMLIDEKLPGYEITTANDIRFDNPDGFNTYNIVDLLNAWDSTYNTATNPIRSEILPDPVEPVLYEESGGKVVVEAETFTDRFEGTGAATGRTWNLLIDDDFGGTEPVTKAASGFRGLVAERNGSFNGGNSLVGPRVDYDIQFDTPGTYNVFIRTRVFTLGDQQISQQLGSDSVHLGLNGTSFTNSSGSGVGINSDSWSWTDDVIGGVQGISVNIPTAGIHTLNIWAREDGVEIDKVVLEIDGTIPTGFGPDASPLIPAIQPPKVVTVTRDGESIDQPEFLSRPDLVGPIAITFDQDVLVNQRDLFLQNDTTGLSVSMSGSSFDYRPDTFTATWDFSTLPNALEPGFYTVSLNPFTVAAANGSGNLDGNGDGEAGDTFSDSFYAAIPGDANLDGTVNVLGDGFALVGNLGSSTDTTWAKGDFNADGTINVLGDGFVLVSNLGMSVSPSSSIAVMAINPSAGFRTNEAEQSIDQQKNQTAVPVLVPVGEQLSGSTTEDESHMIKGSEASGSTDHDSTDTSRLAGSMKLDRVFADAFLI
jgi:hypothetical protein